MAADLGRWQPLSVPDLVAALIDVRAPWWLAGGWALDLFLGRETRPHDDIDVQILRSHHVQIRAALRNWDTHAADPPGTLRPWPVGEALPAEVHDIWCRRDESSPWAFQLMVADTSADDWVYRRDPRIRRPVAELSGPTSTRTLRVLSPDVQLLYKSKGLRPKDQQDFDATLPALTMGQRRWLRSALTTASPGHRWLDALAEPT
jgi:hypothetical protein